MDSIQSVNQLQENCIIKKSKTIFCTRINLFVIVVMCSILILPNVIEAKICNDIDARNNPSDIEIQLRNCTMVVGSLAVVLMDKHNKNDFSKLQFPELKEITGYLLFYRVFGLRTLEYMFPNLKVIRGEKLLAHYSLIFYDMTDIVEIVLPSLLKIQQGYVMIRNCPVLCYVRTIDWSKITEKPQNITNNGKTFKIGNYLTHDKPTACPTQRSCPETCQNCWNNKICQLTDTGYSMTIKNLKCHEECLGDCIDATASGCPVCRNYRLLNSSNICVRECPEDYYILSNLCVNATFCKRRNKIPFMRECRNFCPANYKANTNGDDPPCIKCVQKCPKECPAFEVSSLAMADQLRDCQIIKGDLFIRLHHGLSDTMIRLERNLGDIEEIEGILKVYRSTAITSLSFLRNLRIIHGARLEIGKYSMVIVSNENLQRLWDFDEKKNLELKRGNLLVHFNSKLCLSEIYKLQHLLKTNASDDFIGLESNGYEETCSARDITTSHKVLTHDTVEIRIERIHVPDTEKIVGYIIYYIVAPEQNVTHFGVDTCVQYGWQTHFMQNFSTDANVKYYTVNITNLMQYTQYAYYVKVQVVPKEHEQDVLNVSQGQSNIKYFQTNFDVPTYPKVETLSKTNTSITLNWFPITNEPERIDFYKVDVFRQPDEHSFLDSRNYCVHPRVDVHISLGVEISEASMSPGCVADYAKWRKSHFTSLDPENEWRLHRKAVCSGSKSVHTDQQTQIMKYLGNRKPCTCCADDGYDCSHEETGDSIRFTRQIHNLVYDENLEHDPKPDLGPNHLKSIIFKNTDFNATIDELLPYTVYVFQFFACNTIGCSSYEFHFDRTDSSPYADEIGWIRISPDPYNSNRIHLDFDEPEIPNGLTVAFQIEKFDWMTYNSTIDCITRKQHYDNGKRFTYDHLAKGQYSIRVRSISLAMTGAYSENHFITVQDQRYSILGIIGTIFLWCFFMCLMAATMIFFYRLYNKRIRIRSLNASTQNIMMQMDDTASHGSPQDEEAPSFYHAHSDREFF